MSIWLGLLDFETVFKAKVSIGRIDILIRMSAENWRDSVCLKTTGDYRSLCEALKRCGSLCKDLEGFVRLSVSRNALIFHSKCSRDVAMFDWSGSRERSWKALEGPGRFWGALKVLEGGRGLWEGALLMKTIGLIKKKQ